MTTEQIILSRLDAIEGLLRKLVSPAQLLSPTDNDYTRAERAALDAREKSRLRRELREAGQS